MRSIRQLLRQPMKTLSGILLITLAVSILCVCLGQSITAANMEANLEDLFTSVALITNKHQYSSSSTYDEINGYQSSYSIEYHLPGEVSDWIQETAEKYPDIVEQVHTAGLASAYIPELEADNKASHLVDMTSSSTYYNLISGTTYRNAYTLVMLEITLDSISLDNILYEGDCPTIQLTGTVESVLGLQEGYNDPTGYTARITLVLPEDTDLTKLDLTVGKRYLVYGMDYYDLDWVLRSNISIYGYGVENSWQGNEVVIPPQITEFLPENLEVLSERNIEVYSAYYQNPVYQVAYYIHDEVQEDGSVIPRCINLTNVDMESYRSVKFTIRNQGSVPTIVQLDGTVEEFLSSVDGQQWKEYQEYIDINSHSFAVVGVDDLMAIGDFVLDKASITQGRNFTQEELDSGAKVCILSEDIAQLNGLSVGDTISPQFYNYDYDNPCQAYVSEGLGVINPCPYLYGESTPFAGDAEPYTIVGLYSKDISWSGPSSLTEFTCNTIFAPKSSITSDMDYGDLGIFQSIILKNGRAEDFEAIAIRDGHDGQFTITDMGYSDVKEGLHNYQEVADQAMVIGIGVYVIILVLYLILFPAQQGKTLATMGSMGAFPTEKLRHLTASAMGVLIPGSVLGLLVGMLLWQRVVDALLDSARVMLTLELDIPMMLGIAAAQLVLAALVTLVVSLPMTKNRSLMNREGRIKGIFSRLMKRRMNGWTVGIFGLIIALVLCGLNAANEAEYQSYDESYHNTPVKVTLVTLSDYDAYSLGASGFVRNLFADERFANYTPQKYLTNIQLMSSMLADSVNEESAEIKITGIGSDTLPGGMTVQWYEGFDETVLDSQDAVLIVPGDQFFTDMDKSTPGIQMKVTFTSNVGGNAWEYRDVVTISGTHSESEGFYCPTQWLSACRNKINVDTSLRFLYGTVYTVDSTYENVTGLTSEANPLNLSAQRKCEITWLEGYSADCLNGEEMLLLVPANREFKDMDPEADGTQVLLRFSNYIADGRDTDGATKYRCAVHDAMGTIAGTYTNSIDSQDIYCAYYALETCAARVAKTLSLDHISATLKNNDEIDDLRAMADQWFADPNKELDLTSKFTYALDIDTSSLENLKTTLENSILINKLCTMLVFVLTAGAGFFLGFLMIRQRKREIILMRTLGKPNAWIYRDFAMEQMLALLAGAFIGGLAFLWQPAGRLVLFALVYFAGLSAALIIFLRSTLLTTIKEDE